MFELVAAGGWLMAPIILCSILALTIIAERFWSLLFIGVTSIFTLIYTIRAFQRIWWQQPKRIGNAELGIGNDEPSARAGGDQLLAPAILVLLILILGIWANPLVATAQQTTAWLGDPAVYSDGKALGRVMAALTSDKGR